MSYEEKIVQAAKGGDGDAFRRLVEAFQDDVYRTVISILRDKDLAEDLAQETFIRAYLNLEKLRKPQKIRAWLCGIARNAALKWIARQRPLDRLDEQQVHSLQSATPNMDEVLQKRRMREVVLHAIYEIPEAYRDMLFLFYMRGMKYTEIAEHRHLSTAAVRNRLHKARRMLREVLEKMPVNMNKDQTLSNEFTDRVIAEAMAQGEAFLQGKQWHQARAAFHRTLDIQEDYAPGYRGIGLSIKGQAEAQQQASSETLDKQQIIKAVDAFRHALRLGDWTSETVWPLVHAYRYISDLEAIISLLKQYAGKVADEDQIFRARHYTVDNYALLNRHREAAAYHKNMIADLKATCPTHRLLWSLSDNTILKSWKACDRLSEWQAEAEALYHDTEDTYETCTARAYYLRTLIEAVYIPADDYTSALAASDRLIVLAEKYADRWVQARWIITDVIGDRLSIYHKMQDEKQTARVLSAGLKHLTAYERFIARLFSSAEKDRLVDYEVGMGGRVEKRPVGELHQMHYQFALHDFACICMWNGHYQEAVPLFEKALSFVDDPHTRFFLAGAILKASGDRESSYAHLQQAVMDPQWSVRHQLKRSFLTEAAFEDVWTDERFLALLESEAKTQVHQVEAQSE